jgi:uncharacterized coiled-coil protein SlyX
VTRETKGDDGGTEEPPEERDRIAELEARLDRLEDRTAGNNGATADDRLDELSEEVAALRETTDRLASTLDEALDELDAIRESEYGALEEKRERQFETAVKSMVAFHQLATEVLDVRVENYEPAAGHADAERVETTRDRIVDALDVGQSDASTGPTLEASDEEWPDPEETAREGAVFSGGDEPETTSDAPESGVYPPVGGSDNTEDGGSSSLPESVRTDAEIVAESDAEETHVGDGDADTEDDPWRLAGVDPASAREVRDAVLAADTRRAPAGEAYARIVDEPRDDSADAPDGGELAPVDEDR